MLFLFVLETDTFAMLCEGSECDGSNFDAEYLCYKLFTFECCLLERAFGVVFRTKTVE